MEEKQASPPAAGISLPYFGIALVITVLSFALGLALGFFARPMVLGDKVEVVEVLITATPDPQAIAQASPTDSARENNSAPAASPTAEKVDNENSAPPSIMDMVLADTRHFQGEADAPVTIIEFSDFK
jgi:protein-disulfide isomerase